jgi:DNA-binding response OmpR family regulator
MHVLVVEDDPDIGALIAHYARGEGWTVQLVASGTDALRAVQESRVELIVLDVMLPEMSGFDVCRALRSSPSTAAIPIMMVTARTEEADRIGGIDIGADDYVPKPFSPKELVARAKALMSRSRSAWERWQARGAPRRYSERRLPRRVDDGSRCVTSAGRRKLCVRGAQWACALIRSRYQRPLSLMMRCWVR